MTTARLHTHPDPYAEADLVHPDGTRETVGEPALPAALGISLAVRGYLTPWPVHPGVVYTLRPLPPLPCPPWCPGTPAAHVVHADEHARAYLEHQLHLSAADEAGVILRRLDRHEPQHIGRPSMAVLGDDLEHADALALAETITRAAAHLHSPHHAAETATGGQR